MATRFRVGQAADLLGVSVDTVRRLADDGRLLTHRDEHGQRLVDGPDLARYLTEAAPVRDVGPIVGESARNRFPGVVTQVETDGLVAVVHLQAGPHRITSLMTREAAEELGLQPGDLAIGVVKATNVVVEVPRGGHS